MNAAVLGAGSWGTALSILLARNGHEVALLGRDAEEIERLCMYRENIHYLPGFAIPKEVRFELLHEQLDEVDLTVVAVPAGAVRDVVGRVKGDHPRIVVCSKGLEALTAKRMTEVVAECRPAAEVGVLSGPNLAVEIVQGVPTVAISAWESERTATLVRDVFNSPAFRVSISDDVVGVELGGALKNVLAIGAGMSDGLGFGDNTKGAFLSRGLMEMARLGAAMGARSDTFLGPAGVGDLFATAASRLSRNYRLGFALGKGSSLHAAQEEVGQVSEGVPTSEAALVLARRFGVEAPLMAAVEAVISGRVSPRQAVSMLMERTSRTSDFHSSDEA